MRALTTAALRVFLDLKFHDIPNRSPMRSRRRRGLGVWMLTVQRPGAAAMLRAAVAAARETAAATEAIRPLIVAVTVLTSLDDEALALGVPHAVLAQVERLAALAEDAASMASSRLRRNCRCCAQQCGAGLHDRDTGHPRESARTTPDDQARTLSAAEAMQRRRDYLVVGRPIIGADDPRAAAEQIAAGSAIAES